MKDCPECDHELEVGEYLEDDKTGGFASAKFCMNEECGNQESYPIGDDVE